MRRRLTWLLVTLGIAALVRKLRRRGKRAEPAPPAETADDPADELRRKLAESRTEDEPEEAAPPEQTVEERRADVHDQGRSAVDEMRDTDKD
jgi:hypothetical protein